MTPLGFVLLVAGLGISGLGVAGRIRAARLAGPSESNNVIYEARRLYELPDHGLYVRHLQKSSNRLLVSGASLCIVGIVLML
jgi:hypothetical protein